jgi:hypothetical protein
MYRERIGVSASEQGNHGGALSIANQWLRLAAFTGKQVASSIVGLCSEEISGGILDRYTSGVFWWPRNLT